MKTRALVITGLLALTACDSSTQGALREWTPEDHDQPAQTQAQAPQVTARPNAPETDGSLIELAWQKNCAQCHGPRGRGDGPQAAMFRVPDLTRPDWHERVTDQEITETIRKGRNKMPAFDLPAPVLEGLVKRIRASRARP